jgi:hypothetical protein
MTTWAREAGRCDRCRAVIVWAGPMPSTRQRRTCRDSCPRADRDLTAAAFGLDYLKHRRPVHADPRLGVAGTVVYDRAIGGQWYGTA